MSFLSKCQAVVIFVVLACSVQIRANSTPAENQYIDFNGFRDLNYEFKGETTDELIHEMQHPDPQRAIVAVENLKRLYIDNKYVQQTLLGLIRGSASQELRKVAISALIELRIKEPRYIEIFVDLLVDEEPEIRQSACVALFNNPPVRQEVYDRALEIYDAYVLENGKPQPNCETGECYWLLLGDMLQTRDYWINDNAHKAVYSPVAPFSTAVDGHTFREVPLDYDELVGMLYETKTPRSDFISATLTGIDLNAITHLLSMMNSHIVGNVRWVQVALFWMLEQQTDRDIRRQAASILETQKLLEVSFQKRGIDFLKDRDPMVRHFFARNIKTYPPVDKSSKLKFMWFYEDNFLNKEIGLSHPDFFTKQLYLEPLYQELSAE